MELIKEMGANFVRLAHYPQGKKVMTSLKSPYYILASDFDAPFILDHSTGNWPKNDEIDEPIVYGDYYFLETLIRLKNLN